jgi:protein-tyrosine-phosphatase
VPAVLFVCTGNICRSPFAERYATLLAERAGASGWSFASAGVGAVVGAPIEPAMVRELEERGGSPDGFAARQLDHRVLSAADWVVTFEDRQRRWVLEEFSDRLRTTVTLGRLAATVPRLDPGLTGEDALREAAGIRRPADAADDVPDPYGRAPAAYAACARTIAGHLDVVAGRLF